MGPERGQMEVCRERLLVLFCHRLQYDYSFTLFLLFSSLIYLCVSVKNPLSTLEYIIFRIITAITATSSPKIYVIFRCLNKIIWICINVKCAYHMYWSLEEFNELFCLLIVTVRFKAATRTLCDLYQRTQFSLIHCCHLHNFSLLSVPGYKFVLLLTAIFLGLAFQDSHH